MPRVLNKCIYVLFIQLPVVLPLCSKAPRLQLAGRRRQQISVMRRRRRKGGSRGKGKAPKAGRGRGSGGKGGNGEDGGSAGGHASLCWPTISITTGVTTSSPVTTSSSITTGRFSWPRVFDLPQHSKGGRICANPICPPGSATFPGFFWARTIKINEVSFAFMFSVLNQLR